MMLIAKGGLQLNWAHMHQNFRLKKDRNKKNLLVFFTRWIFGHLLPKCPASSGRHVALLRFISKEKRTNLFFRWN